MAATAKLLDLKSLMPRKNKSNAYRCSICGEDATLEALFELENEHHIIISQRYCSVCLKGSGYDQQPVADAAGRLPNEEA